MSNQQSRGWVQTAMQPFLAFLVVGGGLALFQCAPALTRFASTVGACPSSPSPYIGSSDQIRNYRRVVASTVRGDVAFSPERGVPSLVTVTVQAPLSPEAARRSAQFALVNLVLIRKELLGKANAGSCAVHLQDRSGHVITAITSRS